VTPPIRIRRRWHPDEDQLIGPGVLPWRWTCEHPACTHTRMYANARTRDDAQREANAHVYVALTWKARR
jgi:hypothetical protein